MYFMSGLKPDVFREEMYSRTFDTLEDVIRENPRRSIYLSGYIGNI
jgi:hypothetical protein